MKLAITGAGAIGMLLAYKTAAAGMDTYLITRTAVQKKEIERNGLRLESSGTRAVYLPCLTVEEWLEYPLVNWDWFFCTVKQTKLESFLTEVATKQTTLHTRWLFLQNGLGHLEKAFTSLKGAHIYAAVTTEGSLRTGLNSIKHTGQGQTLIGKIESESLAQEAHRAEKTEQIEQDLCKMLNDAGFQWEVSKNIKSEIWEKLLINAVINPLTGIVGCSNGELLQSSDLMKLMRQLYIEAVKVATAEGIILNEAALWKRILLVCKMTAANRSSMLQDLDHGLITEIDAINGVLIERAHKHGFTIPTHYTVTQIIKSIQRPGGRN